MLAITMGDASGVGPEIVLSAFLKGKLPEEIIVIGDFEILQVANQLLKYHVPIKSVTDVTGIDFNFLNVFDVGYLKKEELQIAKVSQKSGAAALKYVEIATRFTLEGKTDALVTLPMNKEATRLTDRNFQGHTEFIAGLCGCQDVVMMLVSERLIATHVSTHVSLSRAIELAKTERIYKVIRLTQEALSKLRPRHRIAVAGLNPHAGEHGAFGSEENDQIIPAIARAKKNGIDVVGPVPPDTVFFQALQGRFDAVVCMYHDQGHVAMKTLDFHGGVNVTLGLPIVRTSVDHGTAFDIAYKGVASEISLLKACGIAKKLIAFQ